MPDMSPGSAFAKSTNAHITRWGRTRCVAIRKKRPRFAIAVALSITAASLAIAAQPATDVTEQPPGEMSKATPYSAANDNTPIAASATPEQRSSEQSPTSALYLAAKRMESAPNWGHVEPRLHSGGGTSASAASLGRQLYVSAQGQDTADGSIEHPYRSIAFGVSQLGAGDTLYITEGEYLQPAGGAVFSNSGTPDAPITVQGIGHVIVRGTESTTISGQTVASNYNPAFDTNGQSHLELKNFTVTNLRAAVEVAGPSEHVTISGVNADRSHFGILIDGASNITVRDTVITNCRDGIRTDATNGNTPIKILLENINVSGSKNIYPGWESAYRNGDGFIFEHGRDIIVRNSKSYDNWDSGFDIKASNVTLEKVDIFGNYHQGIKVWGSGVVLRDSLIRDTRSMNDDPVAPEGWGVNNRGGSIMFINTTFSNNHSSDIRTDNQVGTPMTLIVNSIIARDITNGRLWQATSGSITEANNIWYDRNAGGAGFPLDQSSVFADPKFRN